MWAAALLSWRKFCNKYEICLHIIKSALYLHSHKGRLAQLVQSTSFTPRGSGVRTPHRPQKKDKSYFLICPFVFSAAGRLEPFKVMMFKDFSDRYNTLNAIPQQQY
jgi:hypothetical protein